ncbi:hypothetical protein DE146DRAFT_647131 [Phaeosphaeria sp. MPI-PUGE-AT-0046c]|nr:hypothetical protein DE146DRAFT_647131 [Phaeosphaeria sp. MPI-PUGE-AT-0046c]
MVGRSLFTVLLCLFAFLNVQVLASKRQLTLDNIPACGVCTYISTICGAAFNVHYAAPMPFPWARTQWMRGNRRRVHLRQYVA